MSESTASTADVAVAEQAHFESAEHKHNFREQHAPVAPIVESSLERHGDKSYYYWQGRVGTAVPVEAPRLVSTTAVPLPEASETVVPISKYLWSDDGAWVKVFVELDAVGALPKENVSVAFTEQRFELRVKLADASVRRLGVDLKHPIAPSTSKFLVKPNKIVVSLLKANKDTFWFDLKK
jgi:hypothetical protein